MAGQPQIKIDWKLVDKLLVEGNSGNQIAGFMGIHRETLYDRTASDKGMMWNEYARERYDKGEASLKSKQYQVAMSGNTTMLIWLGKQRLDQKDKAEDKATAYTPEQLSMMMNLFDQIKKSQQSSLNSDNNNNNNV